MKFVPSTVERSERMQTQILHALANGPVRMPALTALFGIENTHAGRQVIQHQLAALRRRGRVKRIGSRGTSAWALIGHRTVQARAQPPPARVARRPVPVPQPAETSWWLVADEEFSTALKKRATITGWDVALMGTPDRE